MSKVYSGSSGGIGGGGSPTPGNDCVSVSKVNDSETAANMWNGPKPPKAYSDSEMLKRLAEEMYESKMRAPKQHTIGISDPIFTIEDLKQGLKHSKETINRVKAEVAEYERIIDYIENLPFKEGDVAFHREYGNVLISGVCINATIENSSYCILLKNGRREQVPLTALVPISEATKILFSK